jgi:hypothetical protein
MDVSDLLSHVIMIHQTFPISVDKTNKKYMIGF